MTPLLPEVVSRMITDGQDHVFSGFGGCGGGGVGMINNDQDEVSSFGGGGGGDGFDEQEEVFSGFGDGVNSGGDGGGSDGDQVFSSSGGGDDSGGGGDGMMNDEQEEVSSSFGGDSGGGDVGFVPVNEGSEERSEDDDDIEDDDNGSVSDCESVVSGNGVNGVSGFNGVNGVIGLNGVVGLDESDELYGIIGKKFVAKLSEVGINGEVECIQRNLFKSSEIAQAKVSSFQIFTKAVEKRNGGDANVKYAWFGGSKDEVEKIIVYGFGYDNIQKVNGFCDHGIVLSADHSPLESVESATADEDGTRHILLCRVLLGRTELVKRGSMQTHPSSENFQSGVDDLVSPKKYIVWSQQMNTHILPEFVISFKTKSMDRPKLDGDHLRKPVSPWIPIPDLIAALTKILPPKAIKEMTRFRKSYIEHKISRRDMIRGIRQVAGDTMLLMVLKNFNEQRRCSRGLV